MAKAIKILAIASSLLFAVCLFAYRFFPLSALLSLCITFGVFAYHFVMRLTVGHIINAIFHNSISHSLWWFKEYRFEKKLYSALRIKFWKARVPTYAPSTFSLSDHSLKELLGATCQAELIHEIIIVLSFAPVFLAIPFGELWLFLTTSVLSALIDLVFVILQRYNRPRIVCLISKTQK